MPNVNVDFKDHEFAELEKKKGENTWKEFILESPIRLKKRQIIQCNGDKYLVREITDAEMRSVGSDKPINLPIGPNTIIVYTLYTLEKVE